jgi:hypothetical protein
MARKNSVTAENLAALGAERLAALLMELGEADGAVRKRLVLAVAERGGPAGLIKAVDRRLSALATSYGHIPWEKEKAYAADIDGLRTVIAQSLGPKDAPAAAERLIRLIGLAPAVLRRVDDSHGRFADIFHLAVADLGALWGTIDGRDPEALAEAAMALIQDDDYGLCDDLIAQSAPALGERGLAALARRASAAIAGLGAADGASEHRRTRSRLLHVLSDVADAQGDVDGFIAVQARMRSDHVDTAAIASRLIDAGRSAEALIWLDGSNRHLPDRAHAQGAEQALRFQPSRLAGERDVLRIMALEQLGRRPEAQALRWRHFEETLSADVLRAYLRALPDFEDDAALDKAFAHAAGHPSALAALGFLIRWPNLAAAAKLTLDCGSAPQNDPDKRRGHFP